MAVQRTCAGCDLCCRLLAVKALDKPAGPLCPCHTGTGCRIYGYRPQACRDFRCLYLDGVGDVKPAEMGVLFYGGKDVGLPLVIAREAVPGAALRPQAGAMMLGIVGDGVPVIRVSAAAVDWCEPEPASQPPPYLRPRWTPDRMTAMREAVAGGEAGLFACYRRLCLDVVSDVVTASGSDGSLGSHEPVPPVR